MADQQRDREGGTAEPGNREAVDRTEQTVVMSAVTWPSSEPDRPKDDDGHVDYLDTPDGPMQAPRDGVYTPPEPVGVDLFAAPPRPTSVEDSNDQTQVVGPPLKDVPLKDDEPPTQPSRAGGQGQGRPGQPQNSPQSPPQNPQPGRPMRADWATESTQVHTPAGERTQVHSPVGDRTQVHSPLGELTQVHADRMNASSPMDARTQYVPTAGGADDRTTVTGWGGDHRDNRDNHDHRAAAWAAGAAADGGPGSGADAGTKDGDKRQRLMRRGLLVAAGVLGLLVVVYLADLLLARGEVPRGVLVAGVDVGGLDRSAAEQRLRDEVGPRLTRPITLRAGDVDAEIDPAAAGLDLDWAATVEQAGDQPLNPWTRLTSLFGDREVGVVTRADDAKLATALEALRPTVDHEPSEGAIRFEGITPVPVDPRPGQKLDVPKAVEVLVADWADGATVELPVATTAVRSTPESVKAALDTVAVPAVSGPVTITGEGGEATLTPELIASALTFQVAEDGALTPMLDNAKIIEGLKPQLAATEKPGKDATIAIQGGAPVVTPSVNGRGVDWEQSLVELPNVLKATDSRTLTAIYGDQPAKFTTEQANTLGIKEMVAEFTTGGFAQDSGVNIRQIAAEVDGAVVKPGETFSLNKHTGPRGSAQGYVEAGIIDNGRPGRAVGGGASQFATTLYNASYFAGMTDVSHKEHSYYISRYPAAREATVYEGVIDLVFKNDSPSGILIQTAWTPSSVTVRIWSTKHYKVESIPGARTNFTDPNTVTIPHGEKCTPGNGSQGFSVSDTRVVRDANTGAEIKRNTRNTKYNPVPKVVCAPAPGGAPPGG